MSEVTKSAAQIAALEALEQAYAYYTPAPYVATNQGDEPVEYYEYAAAA